MRPADRQLRFDTTGVLIGHANGVRVFVSPDYTTNLVEVDMRIAAGSRDEAPDKAGLAHLVEHAVFELAPGGGPSIRRAFSSVALVFNAVTNQDVTHLQATAPARSLPRVLELYASMLRGDCGGLQDAVFQREREVVRNELRQREDRDDSAFLNAAMYPANHVYHHGVGGTQATLDAITLADVCEFYTQRYTPGNATFVVSGAVDPAQVQELSNAHLRPLPARAAPARAPVPQWQGHGKRRRLTVEGSKPVVALAFRYPPRFHPDELAARHFMVALRSKLNELTADMPRIASARVEVLGGRAAPVMLALIELTGWDFPGHPESVLWKAIEETRELAAEPGLHQVTSQVMRFQAIRAAEPLARRGAVYADYLDGPDGYGFFAGDVARIDALRADDVGAAAGRLFDRSQALTLEILAGSRRAVQRAPTFVALAESHQTPGDTLLGASEPLPGLPALPTVERYQLSNGLSVVLAPLVGMPVVDVRLVFQVGERDAPPSQPHLPALAAHLLTPGAWNAYGDTMKMLLAGAMVEVDVDNTTTTFATAGLGIYVDYLLEGLSAGVVRSEYHPESLRNLRRAISRGQRRERAGGRPPETKEQYLRALFGADCSAARGIEDLVVSPYSTVDLRLFKREHYRAANATLLVVGNFDVALAKNHVEINFGRSGGPREYRSWNRSAPRRPPDDRAPQTATRPAAGVVVEVDASHAQVELVLGFRLPAWLRSDEAAVMLLRELVEAEIASVRERLGASYGLHALILEKCGGTAVLIVGAVDPAHVEEVFDEIHRGLDRLRDPNLLMAALQRARAGLLRELHAEWGDSQAIADRLALGVRRGGAVETLTWLARQVSEISVNSMSSALTSSLRDPVVLCRGAEDVVARACASLPKL